VGQHHVLSAITRAVTITTLQLGSLVDVLERLLLAAMLAVWLMSLLFLAMVALVLLSMMPLPNYVL